MSFESQFGTAIMPTIWDRQLIFRQQNKLCDTRRRKPEKIQNRDRNFSSFSPRLSETNPRLGICRSRIFIHRALIMMYSGDSQPPTPIHYLKHDPPPKRTFRMSDEAFGPLKAKNYSPVSIIEYSFKQPNDRAEKKSCFSFFAISFTHVKA